MVKIWWAFFSISLTDIKKSESGQIFPPDHRTSFMPRHLDCDMADYILDSASGVVVIIMTTANSNDVDGLSSSLLKNKNISEGGNNVG